METNLNSLKKTARLAGLLYFIWAITGIYGMLYISPKIIIQGDAVATAQNMLYHESLFRTGIINEIISNIIWVFLTLVLYRLFNQVNKYQANLMVALVIVQIPAIFFIEALNITSLMLFKGEILKAFDLNQMQDLAMLFLKINDYGTIVLEVFWGLWLLPFGLLVYRSGFIPRIFGVLLILNCIAYIIHSFTVLLFPNYQTLVGQISMPFLILGEISITLWLLIKGVKVPRLQQK